MATSRLAGKCDVGVAFFSFQWEWLVVGKRPSMMSRGGIKLHIGYRQTSHHHAPAPPTRKAFTGHVVGALAIDCEAAFLLLTLFVLSS